MKILFEGNYKSLNDFESEELTPFTIITGKNGSGKSQLIELFKNNSQGLSSNNNFLIDIPINLNKIIIDGIPKPNMIRQENSTWKEKIKFNYNKYSNSCRQRIELFLLLVEHNIWIDQIFDKSILKICRLSEFDLKNILIDLMINDNLFHLNKSTDRDYKIKSLNEYSESLDKLISIFKIGFVVSDNEKKIYEISKYVAFYRKKEIRTLQDSDYFKTPIEEYHIDKPNLFTTQIESLFYNYCKRRDINNINFLNKKEYNDINDAISDYDFVRIHKQPWILINEILDKHKLDFQFTGIEREDFTPDEAINFNLIKKTTNQFILLDSLSSGERIIIGLIIKLFIAKYYNNKLEYPPMLLLDEPDAYLHPEMSKLLIDVLYETFVKEFGIRVIMTTHSPSTIALCPEDCIYQINNIPNTTIKRIDKDSALELLTGFIPTLSIDYKNHKQVFVESETDVEYYRMIFNKLNEENQYPFNLYFISNSNGKGNCDLVKKTIEQIRKSGNKTSFGIIDWDLKNKTENFIKVHGEDKVYSIENYIYNPIYIAIYFMQERGANNIYKELSIPETINHFNIGNNDNHFLQKISDWFFEKYYLKFKSIKEEQRQDLVEFHFLNEKKINIPKWYLTEKGHDLEMKLKQIFPSLDNQKKSEGELQKEIIKIVAKCHPFIPKDSVDLIESLTNKKTFHC